MQPRINYRHPAAIFLYALFAIMLIMGIWWKFVYTTPQRAFNDMLVNNFSTSSVTKNELSTSASQTNLQRINLQLGAQNTVRSIAIVRSDAGSATTETIAKPGVAYVRYTSISEASKARSYGTVTNVWAKSTDTSAGGLPSLFNQSILDVSGAPTPPIGYVESGKSAEMLDYIHTENVFTPDYAHAKTASINGRKANVYTVSVKLAPYLRLMQEFAHVYGLKDLDSVSPSDYQSAAPVKMTVAVDTASHQMVRVALPSTGFNETYTDYGIAKNIAIPTKTISTAELQNRLNAIK